MKEFIKKYSHAWTFSYGILYMVWFTWLEENVTYGYYRVESVLDKYIPFIEVFVVPYLLWFVFCFATMIYLFFNDKADYYKAVKLMATGMTIFLIICTFFPNGQNLRPHYFERDNIFVDLVKMIYQTDTSTNVFPSLHVFNSLGCYIAITHNEKLRKSKLIQRGSLVLTILIVLSTVFLKQHSIIDVFGAFILMLFLYPLVYQPEHQKVGKHTTLKQPAI